MPITIAVGQVWSNRLKTKCVLISDLFPDSGPRRSSVEIVCVEVMEDSSRMVMQTAISFRTLIDRYPTLTFDPASDRKRMPQTINGTCENG